LRNLRGEEMKMAVRDRKRERGGKNLQAPGKSWAGEEGLELL
jgi:hypothetical protein